MTDPLVPPRMRVMWVDNHDDPRSTVKYLHDLAVYRQLAHDHDYGRIVVRPTPGAGGTRASVAIDLLTAIGKNPDVLRGERLTTGVWDLARAWLVGAQVTDVVVDRAHQLPAERLVDLADLAADVDATLWPVWSTLDTEGAHLAVKTLTVAGHQVKRTRPAMMEAAWLPRPGNWLDARTANAPPPVQWPTLPTADFTTFRAAARRHLSPRAYGRVDALYQDAATRTDQWITSHRDRYELLPPALADISPKLVAWLRDDQLGAAPDPPAALITLRATQTALFLHGILLRWTPDTLGPDPAGRLLGDLTSIVTRAITAMGRTDHAAATALSLHLNQPPIHLTCFRCGDITDDGTRLTGPPGHRHPTTTPGHDLRMLGSGSVREAPCETATRLPMHARGIVAAHLAYRRGQGAHDDDPLFVHPTKPGQPPGDSLREGVIRTSRRLNLNPPWLHRSHCKHGIDIGIQPRTHGWMTERGLALFQLDRYTAARIPRPGGHR